MCGLRIKITFLGQKKFKQLEQKKNNFIKYRWHDQYLEQKKQKTKKLDKLMKPAIMSLWNKIQKLIEAIRNFRQ